MMGWISWVSGVVDTAIYPGMFLSFLEKSLQVRWSGVAKQTVLFLFNVVLTGINLVGIDVAGSFSVFFSGVVLMPVAILMLVALPSLQPAAWTQVPAHMDWVRWMNIGIWNTNGFDSISTIGGEIRNPRRTFPLAILLGGALVILPYMLCIMAATGVDQDYASYQNGHYNVIAVREGGWVLGALFTLGTSTAAAGMYLSDLTTYSYQVTTYSNRATTYSYALASRLIDARARASPCLPRELQGPGREDAGRGNGPRLHYCLLTLCPAAY